MKNSMHDHSQGEPSQTSPSARFASVQEGDRRGANRHVFTAAADVTELSSGARFSTRTTDLGPGGCFVDTTNPLPVGARVCVNVRKGRTEFETCGAVVYSQTGLGMGIAFDELGADERHALDAWLADLTGGRQALLETPHPPRRIGPAHGSDHAALVRLVQLMIGKGLLTEAEGSLVLHDPIL
jgi:hypothetical protein